MSINVNVDGIARMTADCMLSEKERHPEWIFREHEFNNHVRPEWWVSFYNRLLQVLNGHVVLKEDPVPVDWVKDVAPEDVESVVSAVGWYAIRPAIGYHQSMDRFVGRALTNYMEDAGLIAPKPKRNKNKSPVFSVQKPEPVPEPEPVVEPVVEPDVIHYPAGYVPPYWEGRIFRKLERRQFVVLYGAAGCGKTHGIFEGCRARGWKLVCLSAPQNPRQIVGGYNVHGYEESAFATAFRGEPGVFTVILIDEGDKMPLDVQMLTATALSERILPLPTGELVEMGDVAVVVTMNTCGNGPTPHYPSAIPWDAALRDRFFFCKVEPDYNINLAVCGCKATRPTTVKKWVPPVSDLRITGDESFAKFITGVQKASNNLGLFRNNISIRGAIMIREGVELDGDTLAEAYEGVISKGASKATLLTLLGGVKDEVNSRNKYLQAMTEWIDGMTEPTRKVRA